MIARAQVTLIPEILGSPGDDEGGGGARGEGAAREEALVGMLCGAVSFFVAVPGHPEHGPFYLVTGVLNVVQAAAWKLPSSRPTIYLKLLALFSAYAQRSLPYTVPGVDSNDVLYAAEPEYTEQLGSLAAQLLELLLEQLKLLGDRSEAASSRAQASFALQLFELVAATTTLDAAAVALAANLHGLAAKSAHVEKAQLKNAAASVARRAKAEHAAAGRGGPFCELHARLRAQQGK